MKGGGEKKKEQRGGGIRESFFGVVYDKKVWH